MFEDEFCAKLAGLTNHAPTHSFKASKIMIENGLKGKLEYFFCEFEEKPLASGAVAQVHKAVLKKMPECFKNRTYIIYNFIFNTKLIKTFFRL